MAGKVHIRLDDYSFYEEDIEAMSPPDVFAHIAALMLERDRLLNQISIDQVPFEQPPEADQNYTGPAPVTVIGTGVPQAVAAAQTAIVCGICGGDVWNNLVEVQNGKKGPAFKCKKHPEHVQWLQSSGTLSAWKISEPKEK